MLVKVLSIKKLFVQSVLDAPGARTQLKKRKHSAHSANKTQLGTPIRLLKNAKNVWSLSLMKKSLADLNASNAHQREKSNPKSFFTCITETLNANFAGYKQSLHKKLTKPKGDSVQLKKPRRMSFPTSIHSFVRSVKLWQNGKTTRRVNLPALGAKLWAQTTQKSVWDAKKSSISFTATNWRTVSNVLRGLGLKVSLESWRWSASFAKIRFKLGMFLMLKVRWNAPIVKD